MPLRRVVSIIQRPAGLTKNGAHPKMRAVRQVLGSMRVGNAKGSPPVLSTTRNTVAALLDSSRISVSC